MKNRNIIFFTIGILLLVAAVLLLSDDVLSPYVSFDQARQKKGSYVQIIGKLDRSKPVEYSKGSYTFTIAEKDSMAMRVAHAGPKPLNFEHADQVVILGRYDASLDIFNADKVLVKCPSKYKKEQ